MEIVDIIALSYFLIGGIAAGLIVGWMIHEMGSDKSTDSFLAWLILGLIIWSFWPFFVGIALYRRKFMNVK